MTSTEEGGCSESQAALCTGGSTAFFLREPHDSGYPENFTGVGPRVHMGSYFMLEYCYSQFLTTEAELIELN